MLQITYQIAHQARASPSPSPLQSRLDDTRTVRSIITAAWLLLATTNACVVYILYWRNHSKEISSQSKPSEILGWQHFDASGWIVYSSAPLLFQMPILNYSDHKDIMIGWFENSKVLLAAVNLMVVIHGSENYQVKNHLIMVCISDTLTLCKGVNLNSFILAFKGIKGKGLIRSTDIFDPTSYLLFSGHDCCSSL